MRWLGLKEFGSWGGAIADEVVPHMQQPGLAMLPALPLVKPAIR